MGPSCLGSPAMTSCPQSGARASSSPVIGTIHSGSTACAPSSMNIWVKKFILNAAETNLENRIVFGLEI